MEFNVIALLIVSLFIMSGHHQISHCFGTLAGRAAIEESLLGLLHGTCSSDIRSYPRNHQYPYQISHLSLFSHGAHKIHRPSYSHPYGVFPCLNFSPSSIVPYRLAVAFPSPLGFTSMYCTPRSGNNMSEEMVVEWCSILP
jgi:hypothetical protein